MERPLFSSSFAILPVLLTFAGIACGGKTQQDNVSGAEHALESILNAYAHGGYHSITNHMTPEMLNAYESAPADWNQVSYSIENVIIERYKIVFQGTIWFDVLEYRDEYGDAFIEPTRWEMKFVNGSWKLNNCMQLAFLW